MLAVVNDHAHVLHLITREGSGGEHFPHPFLDRRDVLRRYRSAFDLVDELEALTTRKRLDAQIHFAELACAAGLLLMAMVAFGLGRDGLAVRNARRLGADLDPVLLLHLIEDVAHM